MNAGRPTGRGRVPADRTLFVAIMSASQRREIGGSSHCTASSIVHVARSSPTAVYRPLPYADVVCADEQHRQTGEVGAYACFDPVSLSCGHAAVIVQHEHLTGEVEQQRLPRMAGGS